MVRQHREEASLFAAQRADEMLAKGDIEGQSVWKHVLRAIGELERRERRGRVSHDGCHGAPN